MDKINTFLTNVYTWLTEKKEEAGQTLVEYALIIALISLIVVLVAAAVSGPLQDTFNRIGDELSNANTSS
jgi:Flp pilus assembly pilin Flp